MYPSPTELQQESDHRPDTDCPAKRDWRRCASVRRELVCLGTSLKERSRSLRRLLQEAEADEVRLPL